MLRWVEEWVLGDQGGKSAVLFFWSGGFLKMEGISILNLIRFSEKVRRTGDEVLFQGGFELKNVGLDQLFVQKVRVV